MLESVDEALVEFSKKRTLYSGAALFAYLAAVVVSQSLLVAVTGGVVVLVVRSWAIDRMLLGANMSNVEMLNRLTLTNRESAELLRDELRTTRQSLG